MPPKQEPGPPAGSRPTRLRGPAAIETPDEARRSLVGSRRDPLSRCPIRARRRRRSHGDRHLHEEQRRVDRKEIPALTGIRGVAACWVVFYHVHEFDALHGPLATLLRHGYLAVDIFFVLS